MTESESRMKKILDALPEMQYVVDRQGILRYFKLARGQKGPSGSIEGLGRPIKTFQHPSIAPLIWCKVQEVFESGSEERCEYSIELPDTLERMHFYAHLDLLDDEEVLVTVRDITAQVKIARELTESEIRYRRLFELNPLPILILDTKTLKFLNANEAAVRHYGYSSEEFLQMTAKDIRPPEDVKKAVKRIQNARSDQDSVGIWRHKRKDGSIILVDIYSHLTEYEGREARIVLINDVTEQIKTQRALTASEEKFRTAFYTSPDAIAISRIEDGVFLEINQGFLDLTGYTREEVTGKSALELGIWPSPEKHMELIRKHQVEGNVKDLEFTLRMKDKSTRDVQISTGTIQLEGKPYLLTVTRDVTEVKRAQHALEASEDKFRTAFMTSPEALSITRLEDGLLVDVNESFHRVTGYSREDVIGKTSFNINLWADPDDRKLLVDGIKEKGYVENLEIQYRMKNGGCLDTLTSARRMDLEGVPHYISIARDYTQIKKAQNALQESEERFRAAFDTSPDAIVILDMETKKISHVNDGFVTNTGYTKEEVLGRTTEELELWEDTEGRENFYRIFGERGTVDGLECNFRLRDGRIFKALISARPMEWTGRLHILVTVRDITSIVETRNQLQKSLAEKEVLLREIHHRVKNNLQVISGLLNLQSYFITDETVKDINKESQNRIKTMALIHEELYQKDDLAFINLPQYIGGLAGNLFASYAVDPDRVRLFQEIEDVNLVLDTAVPCGLIVNELLTNSIKHAFPNSQKGDIRITFKSSGEKRFYLAVSDNGLGLPGGFDIKKVRSMGIQLVRVLSEHLGGELEYDTAEGTTFRVEFNEYNEAGTEIHGTGDPVI